MMHEVLAQSKVRWRARILRQKGVQAYKSNSRDMAQDSGQHRLR